MIAVHTNEGRDCPQAGAEAVSSTAFVRLGKTYGGLIGGRAAHQRRAAAARHPGGDTD